MRRLLLLLVGLSLVFSLGFCVARIKEEEEEEEEVASETTEIDDTQYSLQITEGVSSIAKLEFDADAIIKQTTEALMRDWGVMFQLLGKVGHAIESFNASLRKFDGRVTKQRLLLEEYNRGDQKYMDAVNEMKSLVTSDCRERQRNCRPGELIQTT